MLPKLKEALLKYKSILIVEVALFSLLGSLLLLQSALTQKSPQTATEGVKIVKPKIKPSPTLSPITPENADKVLEESELEIQYILSQVDSDIKNINQIDSSQDSEAGL